MKVSKTVDVAIRETYAMLATKAAAAAAVHADFSRFNSAESCMEFVAKWLKRAGARATYNRYSRPR